MGKIELLIILYYLAYIFILYIPAELIIFYYVENVKNTIIFSILVDKFREKFF